MDLKQLKYFITVADEGSITAGAKKLFLSQPPLSTQLKSLEEELGCVLFERGSRHITLTEPGKTLYSYAKTILDISRVAKEEVSSAADPARGTIRIGMVSSLVCNRALHWVSAFSKNNPGIDFEITEGNTYQLLEQLESGTIHFALIRTPYARNRVEHFRIATDRMVAVGVPTFFEKKGTVSLEEIVRSPLIVYRRWEATLKNKFAEKELKSNIHILADDSRTVVKAAEMGLGVAIVPKSASESITDKNVEIRDIADCDLYSDMEIVQIQDGYLPGCAKGFLQFLKTQRE